MNGKVETMNPEGCAIESKREKRTGGVESALCFDVYKNHSPSFSLLLFSLFLSLFLPSSTLLLSVHHPPLLLLFLSPTGNAHFSGADKESKGED